MRFIDSNIFIYHLAGDPQHGQRATEILTAVESGERTATSTLVVTQVCSYLRWKKKEAVIPAYLALLKKLTSLEKFETSILDFEEARGMQAEFKLNWRAWDDIVIAAQMKRIKVSEIYSGDADFDRIPGIKRIF